MKVFVAVSANLALNPLLIHLNFAVDLEPTFCFFPVMTQKSLVVTKTRPQICVGGI